MFLTSVLNSSRTSSFDICLDWKTHSSKTYWAARIADEDSSYEASKDLQKLKGTYENVTQNIQRRKILEVVK
jgi:hypothetical protein